MSFVHLHCHSTWSLLDGAIPAETLPWMAAELGYDAVALTDHDALTGAVRFTRACKDAGIKPIYGSEVTLTGGEHVTLIARDGRGYANLCRLISEAHLSHERGKPSTTFGAIAERAEGLFVLSGCGRGEVAGLAAAGRIPDATAAARRWREAVGDGYRIEVFDHRTYGSRTLRDRLLGIARETGIPAVATNNVHYPTPEEARTHEVLHAIKEIVPLSHTQSLRANSEYGFKAPFAMRDLFADVPEVCDETLRIAEGCEFELDLGVYHFPELPGSSGGPRETEVRLTKLCYEGAARRFDKLTREIDERLQHELRLIQKMGFSAYFLEVADIVRHTREVLGIRCACRGSAAGSLVCYVLGISDVDPVRYDLLFERFMNERREELPDIDLDVESHRREEVLAYVLDTYGPEQTAMCCMVDTFRARMAIRDVGKALGMPPEEIDLVAKAFPRIRAKDIPQAIERLPELSGSNLRAGQLEQLFELCMAVDGFPRHLAVHPSGVVLSSADLPDRVPMQESFQGFTMLQADKDDVEELGLAKLDVLGVRMLSSISHAVAEIKRAEGEEIDLDTLPHDDPATYQMIRTSKTLGCFQIESPGQRELIARFLPNRFEDLVVDISLFRPGPVKSDMISPYLDRRHGFQDAVYSHESLRSVLAETHGVVVFHEQVIRVIATVTGCSLADADYVRRHLDAERPSMPDDPGHRSERFSGGRVVPQHELHGMKPTLGSDPKTGRGGVSQPRGKSHPGMGREFRGDPEDVAYMTTMLATDMETGSALGEEWNKNRRVEWSGVAGPIVIRPPDDDVATWFVGCAVDNGFTLDQARALWKEVFSFASFGFCKSHAAAFALPTYLSAWLKTHHPAAFLAGVLTHDPGMYPRRLIVSDARHFGVPILPLDVNASAATYQVEQVAADHPHPSRGARRRPPDRRTSAPSSHAEDVDPTDGRHATQSPRSGTGDGSAAAHRERRAGVGASRRDGSECAEAHEGAGPPEGSAVAPVARECPAPDLATRYGIRMALSEVRGISETEIDSIVRARSERPFTSLEDLWRRTQLSQPVLENLIHVGALESIENRGRRELLWRAAELGAKSRPGAGDQLAFDLVESVVEELPGLPAYTELEETEAELEISGIDARRHVMQLYAPLMAELGCTPADRLTRVRNNEEVWVAGVKVASQTPAIRSGQRIIFVTIDDVTGPIDVTVFERVQARCARTVFHSWLLLFRGPVRKRGGASLVHATDPHNVGLTVVVREAFDLAELARDRAQGHSIAAALGRQRRKQVAAGLDTAATDAVPGRLWHSSGGSAGR